MDSSSEAPYLFRNIKLGLLPGVDQFLTLSGEVASTEKRGFLHGCV